MSEHESLGPANVHASGQGVQVGDGGTQTNVWMPKAPPDPVALGALNPHTAVTRLQQLPHDELVDFFARAKPADAGEIFAAFLEVDAAKVVAALGDINPRKAAEFIGTVRAEVTLTALPRAAEAITRKAASLKWTDAGPLERFSSRYARRYKNGRVVWDGNYGAQATSGAIDDYYAGVDFIFPIDDQETAPSSPFGTEGVRQRFRSATVYSSPHGVFRVWAAIDECHENEGGSGGWLGFPVGECVVNPRAGELQEFEGGTVYFYGGSHRAAFAVHRKVVSILEGVRGLHPVSKEDGTVSSSGRTGLVQHFSFDSGTADHEIAVYWPRGRYAPVMVGLSVWRYYRTLGVEKSWLGFPVERERVLSAGRCVQEFESGVIYWQIETDPIAVSNAVLDLIDQGGRLVGSLGFPVSEEQPAGADGSGRIQFFEKGVVTLRDGKREMWLRPGDSEAHGETLGPR